MLTVQVHFLSFATLISRVVRNLGCEVELKKYSVQMTHSTQCSLETISLISLFERKHINININRCIHSCKSWNAKLFSRNLYENNKIHVHM